MKAGEWESPGIKSDGMEKAEGRWDKPGRKSDGMKKEEGKFSHLTKDGEQSPNSGLDKYLRPGIGKEGSGNKELDQRPQEESSADGEMAARFGDPEIHENSLESEILVASSERIQDLSGDEEEAERKLVKFNAGAYSRNFVKRAEGEMSELPEDVELNLDLGNDG